MLSSKANAALTRLREIEEKYKIKREEQRWKRKEDVDSSISSVSLENLSTQSKKSLKNSPKSKLNVKMPDLRFEQPVDNAKPSQNIESDSIRQTIDKADDEIEVTMLSESKTPLRSVEKQESFVSDTVTIQENSSIESVFDDSMTSSKTLSRLETSHLQFPTSKDRSSRRKGKTKVSTKSGKAKESDKIFEILNKKVSSDNHYSSSAKHSEISEKSNEVSKSRSDLKERSIEKKKLTKPLEILSSDRNSRNSNSSGLSRNNSIDESIATMENGSEFLSEHSRVEESVPDKTDNGSASISERSKHLTVENSYKSISNSSKQLVAENGYANDTFENISSSIVHSKSMSQTETIINKKTETIDTTSGHLTVDLVEHELHKEPSHYIEDFERIDKVKTSDVNDRMSRKKSFLEMEMISMSSQESNRKERRKSLGEMKERSMMDTVVLPATNYREKIESTKSSEEKNEKSKEEKDILEGSSDQRLPQNITSVLRKLHRDAIDAANKRHTNSIPMGKIYESSSGRETESEVQDVTLRRMMRKEESQHHSAKKNKTFIHRYEHSPKNNKRKTKVTNAEQIESRDYTESCDKSRALRYDRKQIRELQKQAVELRLQQEREDLQKYLHELRNLRLGAPTPNYFSPLEFPKIAEFTPSDVIDLDSKEDDQLVALRERVSAIKRWLKDQYILYRDYCAMAQAINARYVPTTLEDTKKTIREMRETTIKIK